MATQFTMAKDLWAFPNSPQDNTYHPITSHLSQFIMRSRPRFLTTLGAVLGVFICACGGFEASESKQEEAVRLLAQGRQQIAEMQLREAIISLRMVLHRDGSNVDAVAGLAEIYRIQQRVQAADSYQRKVIYETFSEGMQQLETGDEAAAIRAFEHAVELHPAHTLALIELGKLATKSGRAAGAVAYFEQAREANRSHLDNGNDPLEPALNPSEKAETKRFLKEILQILPLAGLRAFDIPRATVPAEVKSKSTDGALQLTTGNDTIVVPAQEDGFEKVFVGEDCWYSIRISGGMIPKIKWIAAYQTKPVSAITYLAKVARIESYGEGGKYKLVFDGKAQKITPIPLGKAPRGIMQGPRYTTRDKLLKAKKVMDAF